MQSLVWTRDEDGLLTLELGVCRLRVSKIGGLFRYLVYRHSGDGADCLLSLLQSGTRSDAEAAMAAAKAAAGRITAVSHASKAAGR